MLRKRFFRKRSRQSSILHRNLCFERCEDRRMLDAKADIIFLVDESGSENDAQTQQWLSALVTGDNNADNTKDVNSLTEELNSAEITDVRYGLVGFGQDFANTTTNRYAHSQLWVSGNNSLFGDPSVLTTTQFNTAFGELEEEGGDEDGWDAIEHAIAEYEIRPGAVPVFVLLQNDEGRVELNETLTRPGIEAALASKMLY